MSGSQTVVSNKKEQTPAFGASAPDRVAPQVSAASSVLEKTVLVSDAEKDRVVKLVNVRTGRDFSVDKFPCKLGRAEDCHVVLDDESVSRYHASLEIRHGGYVIYDNESLNGLYANEHRVEQVLLDDGDMVKLGNVVLRLRLAANEDAAVPSNGKRNLIERFTKKYKVVFIVLALLAIAAIATAIYKQRIEERVFVLPSRNPTADVNEAPSKVGKAVEADESERIGSTSPSAKKPAVVSISDKASREDVVNKPAQSDARVNDDKPPLVRKRKEVVTKNDANNVIAKKPLSSRARILPAETGQAHITTALDAYINGNAEQAIDSLGAIRLSNQYTSEIRARASENKDTIARLYEKYQQGSELLQKGNKEDAYRVWHGFINEEKSLYLNGDSMYAKRINVVVAAEYQQRGDLAKTERRWHDAYRQWTKAATLDPSSAAPEQLSQMDAMAQRVFRAGYRLETVNLDEAKKKWREVVDLVPSTHEYNMKARAKLRWYAHIEKK